MCEKVDEQTATPKRGVSPIGITWTDTDMALEEEPLQVRSRTVACQFRGGDKADLYAGTLHWSD